MSNSLIRLAGYNPSTLSDLSPDDQQTLVHLGWTVLVGAAFAGLNWGIAGNTFATDQAVAAATAVAIAAATTGALLVLIIDRSTLYRLDAQAGRFFGSAT